jgi:hypothetical protein
MLNPLPHAALDALQDQFALLDLNGEIRAISLLQLDKIRRGDASANLALYKREHAELLMSRLLENKPVQCDVKRVLHDFWRSPKTRFYNETAFTPEPTASTTLNFWSEPTVAACPGNWRLLRDYIRDIICSSSEESYEYLIRFLAHMVQRPAEKPTVMIVMLGGQGTGKGVFFSLLRAIWPQTTLQISDIDHVIGGFNAQVERNYVICMDEALFAGDRKAMDRLKYTVSEPHIEIEQKYQPRRTIKSVHRFFAATNHQHFAHIEKDDRRFIFLEVSASKQQDACFFRRIVAAIQDPSTVGALLYYLRRKDISTFDFRAKPKTQANISQKLLSLEGFDRYVYEVLITGSLRGLDTGATPDAAGWDKEVFVSTNDLLTYYKEFDKNSQRYRPLQSNQVCAALSRLIPSVRPERRQQKSFGTAPARQVRGFVLPGLDTARSEFAAAMGGSIPWD